MATMYCTTTSWYYHYSVQCTGHGSIGRVQLSLQRRDGDPGQRTYTLQGGRAVICKLQATLGSIGPEILPSPKYSRLGRVDTNGQGHPFCWNISELADPFHKILRWLAHKAFYGIRTKSSRVRDPVVAVKLRL